MPTDTRKTAAALDWVLRTLAALGLGASALLLWEYTRSTPMFCGVGGGCDLVRRSSWASLASVPTPVYGVLFFSVVLVLSLVPGGRARRALTAVASVGALGAVGFVLLQAVEIHAFCTYCMIVDLSAIVIALIALASREPARRLLPAGWVGFGALLVAGIGAPFLLASVKPPPPPAPAVPECVLSEQTGGPVTVVVFSDFECPFCRVEHFAMERLARELGDTLGKPVRVVQKHFPLSQHKHAEMAARAAICAEQSARGELLPDLLFSTEDLSPAAIEAAASQLGMDTASLRACMASEATRRRLGADVACGTAARVDSLPTMYIGSERFEGLQKDQAIAAAVRRAAQVADAHAPTRP
jgi:protein-disulfide isomerase/uncharacterized membrane protein